MPRSNQTKRLLAQSLMDLMTTTPLEKISVNDIVDLAQYVLTGKVSKPEFSGKAKIAEIANKVKTFVNEFDLGGAKEWVDVVLDQAGVLLPTATIRTFGNDAKEIEIDAVIKSVGEIVKVSKVRSGKTIDTFVDLAQYVVTGKIVKPQFDGDAEIAEIANKAKAIAARYKLGAAKEWIDCILDQVGVLLPTATIRTVKDDTLKVEIDALIEALGNVVKYPESVKDALVESIVVLAKELADGTIKSPKFNS
ncbi:MAG: hypothetical protein EGR85_05770, partial [Subdoligranulum sp.]|nr:hypothetical protein [Subdoligranulum sp.]